MRVVSALSSATRPFTNRDSKRHTLAGPASFPRCHRHRHALYASNAVTDLNTLAVRLSIRFDRHNAGGPALNCHPDWQRFNHHDNVRALARAHRLVKLLVGAVGFKEAPLPRGVQVSRTYSCPHPLVGLGCRCVVGHPRSCASILKALTRKFKISALKKCAVAPGLSVLRAALVQNGFVFIKGYLMSSFMVMLVCSGFSLVSAGPKSKSPSRFPTKFPSPFPTPFGNSHTKKPTTYPTSYPTWFHYTRRPTLKPTTKHPIGGAGDPMLHCLDGSTARFTGKPGFEYLLYEGSGIELWSRVFHHSSDGPQATWMGSIRVILYSPGTDSPDIGNGSARSTPPPHGQTTSVTLRRTPRSRALGHFRRCERHNTPPFWIPNDSMCLRELSVHVDGTRLPTTGAGQLRVCDAGQSVGGQSVGGCRNVTVRIWKGRAGHLGPTRYLEHVHEGVTVIDGHHRLVFWAALASKFGSRNARVRHRHIDFRVEEVPEGDPVGGILGGCNKGRLPDDDTIQKHMRHEL